ncbi:hypothetical protein HMPREF9136_1804 [Prevotella dentalis DSM 3688]|uniref:Glycosyl hydrolase family 92 domain-containing protein n=1 Tax=Prevotella dentalis (strain ATCC 49559 / DSM 3688 / JCM 13448 / NCTC 12043 / ES 2772) TaxID=908937 RepID=F9D4M6_PREDD|nr:hypothetical protein HMPREF9136_1804 [Prevotella dentalis DSM 3688]
MGRIEVKGNEKDMQKFYTALYHTMIQPNVLSDVNGEYTAPDYSTQRMPNGQNYYTTFSLWDTFRARPSALQPDSSREKRRVCEQYALPL